MESYKKSFLEKLIDLFLKALLLVGIVIAFYKLPSVFAEKISYWKLKNKKINQNYYGEE